MPLKSVRLFHADRRTGRHTDGRTDITKLIVVFCNFSNAPKNAFTFFLFSRLNNARTPSSLPPWVLPRYHSLRLPTTKRPAVTSAPVQCNEVVSINTAAEQKHRQSFPTAHQSDNRLTRVLVRSACVSAHYSYQLNVPQHPDHTHTHILPNPCEQTNCESSSVQECPIRQSLHPPPSPPPGPHI